MVQPEAVDRAMDQMNRGLANLLSQALSWLPAEEAEKKYQAMEDGRGRFLWEPGRRIVVEIDGERFLEVHLYEALAASLWPAAEREAQAA